MRSSVAADEELAFLEEKYRAIEALRRDRAATGHAAPSAVLAALAERFPGALRELDDLGDEVIAERRAAIARVRRGDDPVLPWMTAQAAFHTHARGALAVKRWLAGRRSIGPDLEAAFAEAVARAELPPEAASYAGHLAAVARPPGGRLLALVYARVAAQMDVAVDEVRRLVRGGGLRSGKRA